MSYKPYNPYTYKLKQLRERAYCLETQLRVHSYIDDNDEEVLYLEPWANILYAHSRDDGSNNYPLFSLELYPNEIYALETAEHYYLASIDPSGAGGYYTYNTTFYTYGIRYEPISKELIHMHIAEARKYIYETEHINDDTDAYECIYNEPHDPVYTDRQRSSGISRASHKANPHTPKEPIQ